MPLRSESESAKFFELLWYTPLAFIGLIMIQAYWYTGASSAYISHLYREDKYDIVFAYTIFGIIFYVVAAYRIFADRLSKDSIEQEKKIVSLLRNSYERIRPDEEHQTEPLDLEASSRAMTGALRRVLTCGIFLAIKILVVHFIFSKHVNDPHLPGCTIEVHKRHHLEVHYNATCVDEVCSENRLLNPYKDDPPAELHGYEAIALTLVTFMEILRVFAPWGQPKRWLCFAAVCVLVDKVWKWYVLPTAYNDSRIAWCNSLELTGDQRSLNLVSLALEAMLMLLTLYPVIVGDHTWKTKQKSDMLFWEIAINFRIVPKYLVAPEIVPTKYLTETETETEAEKETEEKINSTINTI